jgi:hypothetical protein
LGEDSLEPDDLVQDLLPLNDELALTLPDLGQFLKGLPVDFLYSLDVLLILLDLSFAPLLFATEILDFSLHLGCS